MICAESALQVKPFFDLRYHFEDNVFQATRSDGRKSDFATNVWTGVDVRGMLGVDTRFAVRYEAAPRRFSDFGEKNDMITFCRSSCAGNSLGVSPC